MFWWAQSVGARKWWKYVKCLHRKKISVFHSLWNSSFSVIQTVLAYSEGIYCFSLFRTTRKYMTNVWNFFVSLGWLENFDNGMFVFLVAIAVVQDRLRITESVVSPNNKSVITFTFVLGCVWCIICKTVAQVSEQSRTDHSCIKTWKHHTWFLPMWWLRYLHIKSLSLF